MTDMPTNNPPLASVRARDAREALEQAIDLIQEAKGFEGERGGPITDHLDFAETWLRKVDAAIDTATTQLLDEIEGRVKGLKRDKLGGSVWFDGAHNAALDEALAAIQELRHGRS